MDIHPKRQERTRDKNRCLKLGSGWISLGCPKRPFECENVIPSVVEASLFYQGPHKTQMPEEVTGILGGIMELIPQTPSLENRRRPFNCMWCSIRSPGISCRAENDFLDIRPKSLPATK